MIKLKQYLKIYGVRHCPGETLRLSVDQENRFVNQGIAEVIVDMNISNVVEAEELDNDNESNLQSEESTEKPLQDISVSEESDNFLNFDEDEYTVSVSEDKKKK